MIYQTETIVSAAASATRSETRLSICRKPNGFSFALVAGQDLVTVADVRREGAGSLSDEATAISNYFASMNINSLDLASAEYVATTDHFAWVPDELYSRADEQGYLAFLDLQASAATVHSVHSDVLHSQLIFATADSSLMAFKIAIPGLAVTCQHHRLASAQLMAECGPAGMAVLNMRYGYADIAAYADGRYLMGCTLRLETADKLIFDTLDVVKTLGIENDRFRLLLCGDVNRATYTTMRPYFAQVALYNGHPWHLSTDELRHLHTYRYALILS